MEFYKTMFTDASGRQTSQIFCVTHSPFIVHSERRHDDKVIVLKRSEDGKIEVSDRPEYYRCDFAAAVADAFSVRSLVKETPTVYLEGQTDEKYFQRAAQIFGIVEKIDFRWIGSYEDDDSSRARNTGSSAVCNAFDFFSAHPPVAPMAFLLDCDVKKSECTSGNVGLFKMSVCRSNKGIAKGIENALVLDDVDIECFYSAHDVDNSYGKKGTAWNLNKQALCDFVCAMDEGGLASVFGNLGTMIKRFSDFFDSVV